MSGVCCQPNDKDLRGEQSVAHVNSSEVLPYTGLLLTEDLDAFVRAQTNATQQLRATALSLQETCVKLAGLAPGETTLTPRPQIETKLQEDAGKETIARLQSLARRSMHTVELMIIAERIFDLDTINQSFGAQLMVQMRWKCPDSEEPPPPDEDDGDWTPEWIPKFRIRSIMEEIMPPEVNFTTVTINGQRWIKGSILMLVRIAEPLELSSFPNDCQDLSITIESKMSTEQVQWVLFVEGGQTQTSATLMPQRCQLNDFMFTREIQFTQNMYMLEVTEGRKFSTVTMTVKVVRKCFYYILNVGVIVCGIISFVFCAWGHHPCDIGGRHDIDFNIILTAVAFKLVLTSLLPAVSYLTRLDLYLFVSFAFLMLITVVHTILPHMVVGMSEMSPLSLPPVVFDSEQEEDLLRYDDLAFYIFAGLWLFWNIVYTIYCLIKAKSEYKQFVQNAIETQKGFDSQHADFVRKSAAGDLAEVF